MYLVRGREGKERHPRLRLGSTGRQRQTEPLHVGLEGKSEECNNNKNNSDDISLTCSATTRPQNKNRTGLACTISTKRDEPDSPFPFLVPHPAAARRFRFRSARVTLMQAQADVVASGPQRLIRPERKSAARHLYDRGVGGGGGGEEGRGLVNNRDAGRSMASTSRGARNI